MKPGGLLLCLEFPLHKSLALKGPPYGLESENYQELLEPLGFERIVYEKPTRFHAISTDKNDMISVWRKKE